MATTITKDGVQIVKQEIVELPRDECEIRSPQEKEQPFDEICSNDNTPERSSPVSITANVLEKQKATHQETSSFQYSNDADETGTVSIQNDETMDQDTCYDDDDDEGEGNLLIDDRLDDNNVVNNSTKLKSQSVQNFSSRKEGETVETKSPTEEDIIILPGSAEISEIAEDEMCDEDSSDKEEKEVPLEKLPRPVNELNCRQSRTYLVKLLRAANGGLNPHYGNPEMKPAFWPDYYWPASAQKAIRDCSEFGCFAKRHRRVSRSLVSGNQAHFLAVCLFRCHMARFRASRPPRSAT